MIAVYLGLGRLLIWVLQTSDFPLFVLLRRLMPTVIACNFCLGFWVYYPLVFWFDMHILASPLTYIPGVTELVVAVATSFIMHLVARGWLAEYGVIYDA